MPDNGLDNTEQNSEHVKTLSETLKENQHVLPVKAQQAPKGKNKNILIVVILTITVFASIFIFFNMNAKTNTATNSSQTAESAEDGLYKPITIQQANEYIGKVTKNSQEEYNKTGGLLAYTIKNPATGMSQEIYYHYAPSITEGLAVTYNTKNKTDFTIESHNEKTDIFGLQNMEFDIYTSAYLSSSGIILQSTDKMYKYELKVNKEQLVTQAIREETKGNVENYKIASVTMDITYGASTEDEQIIATATK